MRTMLAAATLALALGVTALAPSPSLAQGIRVGPGGVDVDVGPDRRYRRGWERRRGWDGGPRRCREVIDRRINRFGERVTRRTRVCR